MSGPGVDINGGFDLSLLRGDNDLAAGFSISNGVYRMKIKNPADGEVVEVSMPVVDINFMMANGKTSHRISIAPDSIIPMIAALSGWKHQLDESSTGQ